MPPAIRPGVPHPVAKDDEHGWELAIVTDGPSAWAVIWDGATPHEGPVRYDRHQAEADLVYMHQQMTSLAAVTKAHPAAQAGVN